MTIGIFIAGLLFGVVLTVWLRRPPADVAIPVAMEDMPATADAALPAPDGSAPDTPAEETPLDRLFRLRREVEAEDERIQRPEDLLQLAQFREGVVRGNRITGRDSA